MKPKIFKLISPYCNMIFNRSKEDQIKIRSQIVKYAQYKGIKAAARHFCCSKNTVKLWKRRYEKEGAKGIINQHCGPKNIPHKAGPEMEEKIINARKESPCFGPKRLKHFYPSIVVSEGAIYRVLKQNNLLRKRRKKHQRKQDLRKVKSNYQALSHTQEDVKHLYDIPYYWVQMQKFSLPKYQYTLRDTKSGFLFLGFSNEYSELYSTLITEAVLQHYSHYGISPSEITIQTDNGSEFGAKKEMLILRVLSILLNEFMELGIILFLPECAMQMLMLKVFILLLNWNSLI